MKIINSEYSLNDFIFFKGNITECVIAVYKNPLFMRYFSLPIDKGTRESLDLGQGGWLIYSMYKIDPTDNMIIELQKQLRILNEERHSVRKRKFQTIAKLIDCLQNLCDNDVVYSDGSYVSDKPNGSIVFDIGPNADLLSSVSHHGIPLDFLKLRKRRNSKVIKDIAREASSNEAFFNLMIKRLS